MQDKDKVRAQVIEALPQNKFKLAMPDGTEKLAYLSGKMVKSKVRVLVGDEVEVLVDPYAGTGTNRIIWRH